MNVAFRSTVPSRATLDAGLEPTFVTVALRVRSSPGSISEALDARDMERRGARIEKPNVRVTGAMATPLWSVPVNAIVVEEAVPSWRPPTTEAVRVNEYAPDPMPVNANDVPVRTPPTVPASSVAYWSSAGSVKFTQRAAASPGPPFVKSAR